MKPRSIATVVAISGVLLSFLAGTTLLHGGTDRDATSGTKSKEAAAIEKMLQEQRGNASLSYLQMQIHRQLGDFQSARKSEVRALTTTKRRRVYHRQEPVPTPGAPRLHRPKTHP